MANNLQRQISLDGPRNVIVKWTGVLDTSDAHLEPALALSDLLNNDPRNKLVGLRVDKVQWAIGDIMLVVLEWNANTAQNILVMHDSSEQCFEGGFSPNREASGYDGSIHLHTFGYPAGRTIGYTVTANFVKLYD